MYITVKHCDLPDMYPAVDIHDGVPSLEDKYRHIGCTTVEPVDILRNLDRRRTITMWIDEEGTFVDDARNGLYLMGRGGGQDTSIYGDLLFAVSDRHGNTAALEAHEAAQIARLFELRDPPQSVGNWGYQNPHSEKLLMLCLYTPIQDFEWTASKYDPPAVEQTDDEAEAEYIASLTATNGNGDTA